MSLSPPSFAHAATAADSFAIAYPPPPKKNVVEIRTLPEAVRAAIRIFAPVMLGLGILGASSAGFCLVSSILVLVQGALWLGVTSKVSSLAIAVVELSTTSGMACCGGTFTKLRGLAIAGIVFACLELALGLGVGIGLGYIYALNGTNANFSSFYCIGYYSCRYYPSTSINSSAAVGIWLFYAAGNSIVAAALNISLCVVTLHLLQMFAAINSSSSPAPAQPPAVVPA